MGLVALGCSDSPTAPTPVVALAWSVALPGPSFVTRTLLTANNAVYVQLARSVLALRADSGRQLWTSDTTAAPNDYGQGLLATPTQLLVRYTSNVQALGVTTGAVTWTYSAGNGVAAVAADGANAYIASGNRLAAVALASGTTVWNLDSTSVCDSNPCIVTGVVASGDTVLFLSGAAAFGVPPVVRAVRASTGAMLWTVAAVPTISATPSLTAYDAKVQVSGSMLVLSDLLSGFVMGIDRMTPRVVWSRIHGSSDVTGSFPVVTRGDTVFASGRGGGTEAIRASTGALLWQQVGVSSATAFTPCGGQLLLRTLPVASVQLWVLSAGDGRIRGGFNIFDLWPITDPVAVGSRAFVGTYTLSHRIAVNALVALDCTKL